MPVSRVPMSHIVFLVALMVSKTVLCAEGSGSRVVAPRLRPEAILEPISLNTHHRTPPADEPSERAFTEGDAVSMRLISGAGANSNYGGTLNRDFATFSPDGSKFVIILKRGNIQNNTVEYSLLLYHTIRAFASPRPIVLVSMSSSSNRDAINNVSWLADNDTILFIGEHERETSQLYSIRCSNRVLKRLTHQATNVEAYSADSHGHAVAFITSKPIKKVVDGNTLRYGLATMGICVLHLPSTHEWSA